jgi:hypothetical protein
LEIHNNFFDRLERAVSPGDTFPSPPPSESHLGQPDAIVTHPIVPSPKFKLPVIGYVLTRPQSFGLFLGTTPEEVGKAITEEIRNNAGLSVDEIDTLTIRPQLFTQTEIDSMGDFPGW